MGDTHEVIVGNIGTVYDGTKKEEAKNIYLYYTDTSNAGVGRQAGESVTWLVNGEIREFTLGMHDRVEEV